MKQQPHKDEEKFEALYRSQYSAMYRYATVLLKSYRSQELYVSGRAEEAVQEAFATAWEKRQDLFSSPSPPGWLFKTVHYKVQELMREDQTWTRRILRCSEAIPATTQCPSQLYLKAALSDLMSSEEYQLLKNLYLDGYTYKELSARLGVKQSTLAMRVKRLKERLQREFEDK